MSSKRTSRHKDYWEISTEMAKEILLSDGRNMTEDEMLR